MHRILVTNDDGISSKGLTQLAEALARVGEVVIVAPSTEQSASAHSLTLTRPLRVRKHGDDEYSVDGTPTDCVTLAMSKILEGRLPGVVVSGINYGPNLGDDVTYSGTVAGALEASVFGLPGIAFSLATRSNFDFSYAAAFAAELVLNVIETGLPEGTILNVNVPPGPINGSAVDASGDQDRAIRDRRGVGSAWKAVLLDWRAKDLVERRRGKRLRSSGEGIGFDHAIAHRHDGLSRTRNAAKWKTQT